jgi:hypothetical protein
MGVEVGCHARVTAYSVSGKPVVVGGIVSSEADEEFKSAAVVDVAAMIQYVFDEELGGVKKSGITWSQLVICSDVEEAKATEVVLVLFVGDQVEQSVLVL